VTIFGTKHDDFLFVTSPEPVRARAGDDIITSFGVGDATIYGGRGYDEFRLFAASEIYGLDVAEKRDFTKLTVWDADGKHVIKLYGVEHVTIVDPEHSFAFDI